MTKQTNEFKTVIIATVKAHELISTNNEDLMQYAQLLSLAEWRNEVAQVLGEHYKVKPHKSQKFGWLTFDKDTAAEQMLSKFHKLHPASGAKAKSSAKTDPVDALLSKFAKLTAAEQRAFLKAVAK